LSSAGDPAAPSARPSPFRLLRPVAAAACGYALAALVWLTFGDTLPGGRWFAVHLFTLGILSNLVVALTEHFTRLLLHSRARDRRLHRFVLLNAGALLLLGFPPRLRFPLAAGGILVAATVAWLAVDLHRMRRAAGPDARFSFVVRAYEHACGMFLVGATLGTLLGVQVLTGPWYGAGRLAHLHANVLGWGGLSLLATVVFFGPTMMRTRMRQGADGRAARALLVAAGGLAVAVGALLLTGATPGGTWPRLLAGAGLAVYAAAATVVCWEVLRTGRTARHSAHAWLIQAACAWFVAVTWFDAFAVASGRLRLLDALGAVLIVAVLGQAILAALNYLTPMVWAADGPGRAAARARLEAFAPTRVALLNGGIACVLVMGLAGRGAGATGAAVARTGWALVAVTVLAQVALIVRGAWALLGRSGTARQEPRER
jgi:hypothetical protein